MTELYRGLSQPTIIASHIDGPLLVYSDGQMHWLTLWERFLVAIGKASASSIQSRRRPDLKSKAQPHD